MTSALAASREPGPQILDRNPRGVPLQRWHLMGFHELLEGRDSSLQVHMQSVPVNWGGMPGFDLLIALPPRE